MAKKRAVVKFGGAELRSGGAFRQAAEMVKKADFKEVVVVVSAMEKTTDNLISHVKAIGGISDMDYADIVSMGERISARIFTSALKAVGLNSTYFDPQNHDWPIITDSNFLEAEPDLEETRRRVKTYVEPLLGGGCIPVVCGFIGKDREGRVTLLGRGGSDITATLLGNCLNADEVILVKNTEGVLSADPTLVPDAKPLQEVSVEEMFSLAQGGAKIVHPKALKYKLPHQKLRVASFNNGLFSGTEIVGAFSNPFDVRLYEGLCAITLVGELDAASLGRALMHFAEQKIVGLSTGRKSVTVFAEVKNKQALVSQLCQTGEFKGVSLKENVGAIEVLSPEFIESPGWVARISSALAEKGINIVEVSSSKATITVFLEEKDLEKALEAIKSLKD
ncbi:MAG: aspartate kinase [Candidatus Bathyarchaeia archaeon]